MAKLTLNTIGSRYGSIDALNANFDAIETALENTLSRDGTLPNNMDANLDMDSNRIINMADAINNADAVTLRQVNGIVQGASSGLIASLRENFVATSGQTVFNISSFTYNVGSNNLAVYLDGVRQYPGTSYTETDNNTITFSAGLHAGALVMLISNESVDTANLQASAVHYTPAGTGAVATNVQAKLRQYVSVKDFGAIGDGTTDDTAAIQAALNTGKAVYFPYGTYSINSSLQITADGQILYGDGRYNQTIILWSGSTNDTVIETNNSTLKIHVVIRDLRIQFTANGTTGINWSNISYGTIENVNIDGYGSNTVGVRLKGNGTTGDRPYYNQFRQVDIASNNVAGVTTGSIGWYGQRDASATEAGNFNGPNANQWIGGRCSGMSKAFYFEDAIGNSFYGCTTESILTNHFEFGVSTPYYPSSGGAAVFTATVNSLTDNSSIPMTTNQYVNGMIYILSGTGAGQYRAIGSNTTSVFTVSPYWDVVPDNTSTYQLFPEAGQSNTIQGCYGEGDSTSAPTYLKLNPGPVSTYIYGGIQSSLGVIVDDIPRVGNRLNPGGWKDPVAITFSTVNLPAGSSSLALYPVDWFRNNLSIPGYWNISAIDVGINGAITSGTIKLWVTQNGTKLNVNPDMQITSTSSFNTGGGSVKQELYGSNEIVSTSGYSQFGVVVDSDSGLLPAASLDLYVTLYIVARG